MDGDEMTRIIWEKIKEKVRSSLVVEAMSLNPYLCI